MKVWKLEGGGEGARDGKGVEGKEGGGRVMEGGGRNGESMLKSILPFMDLCFHP